MSDVAPGTEDLSKFHSHYSPFATELVCTDPEYRGTWLLLPRMSHTYRVWNKATGLELQLDSLAGWYAVNVEICPQTTGDGGTGMFTSFDPMNSDGQGGSSGSFTVYGNGLTGIRPAAPFVIETATCDPGYTAAGGGTITITGTDFLDPTTPLSVIIIEDNYINSVPTLTDTTCVQQVNIILDPGPQTLMAQDGSGMFTSNSITVDIPA